MEIAVVGRHAEVSDRFRRHVEDKLAKVSQLAPRAQRVDVEITHEKNPRQSGTSERVELTVRGKGPVVRAEASADDPYAALDLASAKLMERLRRARDRHKDRRKGTGLPDLAAQPAVEEEPPTLEVGAEPTVTADGAVEMPWGDSPVVIREKLHHAEPMSLDDALYEMEMVGHDFFLFVDAETSLPSVAYRRRGWSYGVIRLDAPVAVPAAAV
ncbi:ribosome-associated translation inhibitor RaiA [Isoptericola sp. b441]|uniref:Ribosome hibernation promoting factor n=1 Tax=Actinotalea lenta TaxID=3064654 RepID=A0ABT9DCH5_9CELL|nr:MULTISPECIES: ribosome-associated translation inhibitor RaiA [unclassified Isoptericola]MDO8108592.1 ribosome-associated translation inhibitor RaiA [Isoptericola sp. b441]MDO8120002.1 ribosome-associated translation inhibitor RaiA [Isoptericola sp. b490]